MRCVLTVLAVLFFGASVRAEEAPLRLAAPAEMIETGVFDYILPRFRLKTQVRIELAEEGDLELLTGGDTAVFKWQGETWRLSERNASQASRKFVDWLASDIGQNTLAAFQPEGAPAFLPPDGEAVLEAAVETEGDTHEGDKLAHFHCGRCHVVSDKNRMGGIGSTPSFGAMKNFPDWEAKFAGFFTLNPHPSFTQITGLTEPFAPSNPPPIAPVEMSEEDYEAILAYVSQIPVKDLGGAVVAK